MVNNYFQEHKERLRSTRKISTTYFLTTAENSEDCYHK